METFKSSHQNSQVLSKYSGEKHLPLGPGTRLDTRLNESNIPKPGEEPINEIDKLAYMHISNNHYSRYRGIYASYINPATGPYMPRGAFKLKPATRPYTTRRETTAHPHLRYRAHKPL